MEPWQIWLIVAGGGLAVVILGLIWASNDFGSGFATLLIVVGIITLVGGGITAGVLGAEASKQSDRDAAAEQGLTMLGTTAAKEQAFYEVTVNGKCTINADKVDGKFVVIGSDPVIELTPAMVNYICYGGPS